MPRKMMIAVVASVISLAVATSAQAGGVWNPNNGTATNGLELNGRSMQGVQPNGVAGQQLIGGIAVLSIELPAAQ